MAEENSFKFACPHCGQHIEADADMVGMTVDCPVCGQSFEVPRIEATRTAPPVITVIRKRERFVDRCKKKLKAVGIGVVVLLLFIGVGVLKEICDDADSETSERTKEVAKAGAKSKAVLESIECLLNFFDVPNERRLQVLSNSLESCPADFRDAMKEYLVSATRTSDDMISDKDKTDMAKARVALGLLLGAACQDDPQAGVSAGLQFGDLVYAEAKEKANQRLRREIEEKRNHLIEVAQKYGVDAIKFENALIGCGR